MTAPRRSRIRTLFSGYAVAFLLCFPSIRIVSAAPDPIQENREFEAAKTEFEAARSRYVHRLAQLRYELWEKMMVTGKEPPEELWDRIDDELRKNPLPVDGDREKRVALIDGRWESPRRIYLYRKDGIWGSEDREPFEKFSQSWKLQGNQLLLSEMETNEWESHTILVLDQEFFVFSYGESIYFHRRVEE